MPGFDPYDSLVPVFLKTEIPQRLRQMGTAIFVELHGEPFLYTAAHVTDDRKHGELLVPIHDGLWPIEGYVAYIDQPPEIPRSKDDIDIAYYRLSSGFAAALCHHFQPLPQSRCELIMTAMELAVCSAAGYPASKGRKSAEGTLSSEVFSFRGVAACEDVYEKLGLSPEMNIVINFSKKRAIHPDTFEKFPTPSLKGVSGGGIFAWPKGEETSSDWSLPKLVGLAHTFKEKEGLIIGTPLLPIITAIQLGHMKGFGGIR
jgi:hypothetical protein